MKSYKEIAANVLKRRDEYLAKQKKKKRVLTVAVTSAACCCVVLSVCYGLWQSGMFHNRIPMDDPQDGMTTTTVSGSTVNGTTTQTVPSQTTATTRPTTDSSTTGSSSSTHTTSTSSEVTTTTADETTRPSETTTTTPPDPPSTGDRFVIDSIDKVNFYSAKKVLNQSVFPFGMMSANAAKTPPLVRMNTYEYPIDRNKVFTITMVTYFTIELHDENGFLAQKLGGTGEVEVVVTQNDLEDLGQMITFKRGESYYTCFANETSWANGSVSEHVFSSHKYIEGFNIIKNYEQENYQFTVRYDKSNVVGFECEPFKSTPSEYAVDEVTLIEDYCAVIFTRQYFTIDMLETFFGAQNAQERL